MSLRHHELNFDQIIKNNNINKKTHISKSKHNKQTNIATIASYESVDMLLWWHHELNCEKVNTILKRRLESGDEPTLPYGKLVERFIHFIYLFMRLKSVCLFLIYIYLCIYLFIFFIYLFICLFVYLFIYSGYCTSRTRNWICFCL
jgi:hypothetical protein